MCKNQCSNCVNFSNENHVKDKRTQHAGICSFHACVVFLTDSCKNAYQPKQTTLNDIHVNEPEIIKTNYIQTSLF